ncbi:MAG: hypothetical protein AB1798_03440 [Spirochaetota bacterium]
MAEKIATATVRGGKNVQGFILWMIKEKIKAPEIKTDITGMITPFHLDQTPYLIRSSKPKTRKNKIPKSVGLVSDIAKTPNITNSQA